MSAENSPLPKLFKNVDVQYIVQYIYCCICVVYYTERDPCQPGANTGRLHPIQREKKDQERGPKKGDILAGSRGAN